MASVLRPSDGGEPSRASACVDARAGTRVAIGLPLVATLAALTWVATNGSQPELSFWTMLVLPAICAAYGVFQVMVGSRVRFSFELPTVLLAGLVGGPLAGVLAGIGTGLGDVGAVWRRRSAYAGLAMLQGFAAGLAGDAWRAGSLPLPVAVVLAGTASLALALGGNALVMIDRQTWPSPWFKTMAMLDVAELVLTGPFLVVLASTYPASPFLVSLVAVSALGIVGLWALTTTRRNVEVGHEARLLDPLTGALSRPAFEGALAREQERVLRGEQSAGLVICDIDHFGLFNERFGHLGGDRALRFVVGEIQAAVRAGDLVARWGGDEICVIAPGIGSVPELEALCERVRQSVPEAPLLIEGQHVSLTVSAGATLLTDWSSPQETFARADEALYLAKRTRNAVSVLAPRPVGEEQPAWALMSA